MSITYLVVLESMKCKSGCSNGAKKEGFCMPHWFAWHYNKVPFPAIEIQ